MSESQQSWLLKVGLMVCIFTFGCCGILTPRCFDPFGDSLSYANLVSCGVIISAALVHLLSDASKGAISESYPWSYFICGLSFISLFAFERLLIHTFLHKKHHRPSAMPMERTSLNQHHVPMAGSLHVDHHHGEHAKHAMDTFELMQQKHYLSGLILFCGLGLHSVLAGLALGSSTVDKTVIALGIAILSHKYLAAFAIGCSLLKSAISLQKTMVFAALFGMLTPIGIMVGLCIESRVDELASNVLICIAAGALLYAAVCEVMIPEFSEERKRERQICRDYGATHGAGRDDLYEKENKIMCQSNLNCAAKREDYKDALKLVCVFTGFGVMSTLALWV